MVTVQHCITEILKLGIVHRLIAVFTDSQAVIKALGAIRITLWLIRDCACALNELGQHCKVILATLSTRT